MRMVIGLNCDSEHDVLSSPGNDILVKDYRMSGINLNMHENEKCKDFNQK